MRWLAALLLCALAAACAPVPKLPTPAPAAERVTLTPVGYDALAGWAEDTVADALPVLLRSCGLLARLPDHQTVGHQGSAGTVADWRAACRAGERVAPGNHEAVRRFFESWFTPHLVADGDDPVGTFTGYYEAELKGSLRRSGPYQTPLLGKPADLVTVDLGQFRDEWRQETIVGRLDGGRLRPYPDRAHIESGKLGAVAQPILWASDPVDAFMLHIQGSGRVLLDDGGAVRVAYAANNGHKFIGIAKLMIERGLIRPDQASMQAIRVWLRGHPEEARALMAENPRYIFFRLHDGDGPVGAQGVTLAAGRSLAVDPRHVPLGAPLWLDTTEPAGRPLRRLMVAQDTGGAITGPVRGDFFWGYGEEALEKAGRMKSRGRYFLLLPRTRTAPVA
ncbi:MAG: murein transglycosylase A [Alphaproteobacteria bacterium]